MTSTLSIPGRKYAVTPWKEPGGALRARGAAKDGAVVVTVTVTAIDPEPLGVAEVGFTVQVASEGAPLHAKLTAWLNPPTSVRLIV